MMLSNSTAKMVEFLEKEMLEDDPCVLLDTRDTLALMRRWHRRVLVLESRVAASEHRSTAPFAPRVVGGTVPPKCERVSNG